MCACHGKTVALDWRTRLERPRLNRLAPALPNVETLGQDALARILGPRPAVAAEVKTQ